MFDFIFDKLSRSARDAKELFFMKRKNCRSWESIQSSSNEKFSIQTRGSPCWTMFDINFIHVLYISSYVPFLYFTFLSHLFPLPCGAGSTVPIEGFDSSVIMLFPAVLWLWHFLYNVDPHPVPSLHIYAFVVSRAFMAGAASRAGDADSSRAPGFTSGLQGSMNVQPWCSIVGATMTVHQFFCSLHFCHTCSLCRVELDAQFPARGSTQVLLCFFSWCVVTVTLPI